MRFALPFMLGGIIGAAVMAFTAYERMDLYEKRAALQSEVIANQRRTISNQAESIELLKAIVTLKDARIQKLEGEAP